MRIFTLLLFSIFVCRPIIAADPERLANTIVLDETSVKNLGIETVEAEETTFEDTFFALGSIEVLPGKRAVVSSRIPGRVFSVLALPDQEVEEGEELMWVESRQPGDPPPTIMLEAPMAGHISKVDIAVGQPISPDQSLIEIVDLSVVEAAARVPQHLASQLKKGMKAQIRVPGFPGETFEAELAHLGAYADESNATLEAAFHVQNADKKLRPGMMAEFNFVASVREGVMSIPKAAVQGDAAGRYVFIKDYDLDHAFVKVPLQVGSSNAERTEVLVGLLPGDEVVTKGAYALSFAGKGSVSLKEAMDAAHGHPHNEDGSEMTKEQIAAEGGHEDHDHSHGSQGWTQLTRFFAATSALLLLLLIVTTFVGRKNATA